MTERFEVRVQPAARRAINDRLPEQVAAAVIEFLSSPLTTDSMRVGRSLSGPLTGCRGARRGTYRIVCRIDHDRQIVQVLDVDHRSAVYRRR